MKQLLVLAGCAVFLSGLVGCQSANRGVEVIIEGGGEFPELLVGIWKADKHGWGIVFEPDGTISSAVHTIARFRVKPGQVTTGGQGVFEAGKWLVKYTPESRELLVRIVLKQYRFEFEYGDQVSVVEGSSEDMFVGEVSEDGQEWRAEWFAFPEYVVTTDIFDHHKLPLDPNDNPRGTLVFRKQPVTN